MKISDEMLMAYADGEGDTTLRARVETAMREDPEIAKRVAQHRAMREAMSGAFSSVTSESVPQRLIDAARGRAAATNRRQIRGTVRRWQPLAIAASLLLGIGVGYLTWHGSGQLIEANKSGLVAGAALADALSTQLSQDRSAVAVTGLSFRDKAGGYCRTFSLSGPGAASGLACREGNDWKIKALTQSSGETTANFRPAGSDLSSAVRAAVEESIDGEPLNREAEIAARQAGWSAPLADKRGH